MKIVDLLLKEVKQEAVTTRKMLALVPEDKYSWKPHEKSMNLQSLITHIAELPGWIRMGLLTDGLDFQKNPYSTKPVQNAKDLMKFFEKNLADGVAQLSISSEEDLLPQWTMRVGDHVISISSKQEVIRMSISQTIHHRAQLGVYLRLLNIPLPGSYGPTADEQKF